MSGGPEAMHTLAFGSDHSQGPIRMDAQEVPHTTTVARFVRAVRNFADSEVGGKAKLLFAALVALLCGANGLNVLNSYVGRNFMTAIADRDKAEFIRQAIFYVGVFAGSTVVAVVSRFAEERLGLLWRESLTQRAVKLYLANRTYYRLDVSGELANPDQRIAEDVRVFTVTTLSFVLMLLNSSFTIIAFSGVLWSISPLLFILAVVYAACGSFVTIVLGRPLIKLNHDQLDKEASFRSALIHVRQNAESIMLAQREERQTARLLGRLDELVANFRQMTSINRNVGFFTTGYNWLIQIIPALVVAPAFIRGEIDFGAISQSAVAFSALVAAFSLIVTQFQSLSTFAAVVGRLSSMTDAIERPRIPTGSSIEVVQADGRLAYEQLNLLSANASPLLKDLSLSISVGRRVLVTGSQAAGAALCRATAGVATPGSGRIIRPSAGKIGFIAQRPYLPPGPLRQVLQDATHPSEGSDDRILALLHELNLEQTVTQAGGLDTDKDWGTLASLSEQQLLALVHIVLVAPQFVFLDRLDATLSSDQVHKVLHMLAESSITCINIGAVNASPDLYEAVLECTEDGGWAWTAEPAAHPDADEPRGRV
jgi:vitamin B12/bleomycin/antimicrobial peptide transport system ATP-binding/permease protein